MSIVSATQKAGSDQGHRDQTWLKKLVGFLLIPALTFAVVLGAAVFGLVSFENSYQDRIYPGVVIWNTNLSGMTRQEAEDVLLAAFPYPNEFAFSFRDPGTGQTWVATPAQLGVTLDTGATIDKAFQVGRGGVAWENFSEQFDSYQYGRHFSPILISDNNATITFLESIAVEIYRPVIDAGLIFAEEQLITIPSQIGRQMNLADAHGRLMAPLSALEGAEIELLVDETLPGTTDDQIALVLSEAEQLISEPITVFLAEQTFEDDPQPQVLSREALGNMLLLELDTSGTPPRYLVRLDETALTAWLEPLAPVLETEPVNARFIFNDDTGQLEVLENSVPARQLNIPATVAQILAHAATDDREIPLVIEWIKPLASEDATGEELGITGLVAVGQTQFTGSSDVRVHNVAVAASRFHGIVLAPGETFSFNKYLGDVSEETGFEEGLIIFGGRTIKGVGGGVCQVSTTAFQAAFYAGLPILERTPHGYRVGYYEHGEGPGMDATVFYPVVDFKFVNESPYHLLIETYTNETAQKLTFKFYSTGDGRTVEKADAQIYDVVTHPPDLYVEDPELPTGEIEQVDWSADGANVLITRVVRNADGSMLREDNFFSHYLPWQAIFNYGPGTEGIPTPEGEGEGETNPEATPPAAEGG